MSHSHFLLKSVALLLSAAAPLALSPAVANPSTADAAKPKLGSFGVDMSGMDNSVKPGDQFFDYVNGTWAKTTEIPGDQAQWGMFQELRDLSLERTRDILNEMAANTAATGDQKKAGDYYGTLMDEAAIEKAGLSGLKTDFDAIAAIKTRSDLARAFGMAGRGLTPSPIDISIDQDLKDPTKITVSFSQGGLGMPNRDYYLEANFAKQKAAYQEHVARMLELGGSPAAKAKADAAKIVALETEIARVHWTNVQNRDVDKLHNIVEAAHLGHQYAGLDWAAFTKAAGVDGEASFNIAQPSAITGLVRLISKVDLANWQAWMRYHTLKSSATVLPKAVRDERFAFFGKTLSGLTSQEDRWKQASTLATSAMGDAISQVYVARYFPPEAKAQADELVKNIIIAMDKRLQNLTWMDAQTKAKARAKLASFTPKIGYPDKWLDYATLQVVRGDAVGNLRRSTAFEYNRQLAKLGKPIDRSEWFMTPMTVNAYANPTWNEIVFPAAILQPPFFDPHADAAVNYGGIGAVIGHEISHHFDDQGSRFDAEGRLADWWTKEDVTRFKALTDKLVKQVETYEPLPGKKINGSLSLGENLADIAGLNIAWDAWQVSLGGKQAPVIDGKTGAERFYLGFGQIWRTKYREAAMERQLTVGPHSPGNFRPLTARNHDQWYDTFGVKPGDKLYLTPEERVRIW